MVKKPLFSPALWWGIFYCKNAVILSKHELEAVKIALSNTELLGDFIG